MMPRAKTESLSNAPPENISMRLKSVPGRRNVDPNAIDRQKEKADQDPPFQFGYLKNVLGP
jgi:hypothetical protein